MSDNSPFHSWVPKPLGIAVFLLMFAPLMFAGGTYLGNVAEMVGAMGLWSEDFQMASSCAFMGMAAFFPFMVRYIQVRDVKLTYVCGFAALVAVNLLLVRTESVVLQCLLCFVLGVVRVMLVLNTTFAIAPYAVGIRTIDMFTMTAMPDAKTQYSMEHLRAMFLPALYLLLMTFIELSNYAMAWIAYTYTWQFCYHLSNLLIGVAAALVLLTMRFGEPSGPHYRFLWGMTGGMLLTIVLLLSLCYTLIYGKTLDWLSSPRIRLSASLSLLSLGLALIGAKGFRFPLFSSHYLDFRAFQYSNVWLGILLFIMTVLANYGNSLIVMSIRLTTPASNVHVGAQSLWCIGGIFIGWLLTTIMVVLRLRYKHIFAVGFALMCAANIYLYFQYQPQTLYGQMRLAAVINFAGMIMPYAAVCAYGMCRLPSWLLPTWLFLMIAVRNVAAPSLSAAVYSSLMQERQQHYVVRLAQDAPSLADARKVQSGATLLSMKDITGGIVWLTAISAVTFAAFPKKKSIKS